MKKYPAFIVDRSRRSEASRFTDDFIVCTDSEVGFIARLYKVPKSRRDDIENKISSYESLLPKYYAHVFEDTMIVLEIEQYLNKEIVYVNRILPLMKKAMKAYLYGEEAAVKRKGIVYDDQIAAIDDVIRMAEAQKSHMVEMNGEAGTRAFTDALRSARDSVLLLQKIVKND